ncbi:MAG: 2-oxoglutarate dehydrogenase E1 component [Rhodospirillales bacterium]|nr:2-oxoglutarate dehydrogenase E1 component [Rhodospirillales bacterium]
MADTALLQSLQGGAKTAALADLYRRYVSGDVIDRTWRIFFTDMTPEALDVMDRLIGRVDAPPPPNGGLTGYADATATDIQSAARDSIRALMLIRSYRVRGHLMAKLDPLGLKRVAAHPELDYRTYGFTDDDLDRPIFINMVLGRQTATIREIVGIVQKTYCDKIGVEFMHIQVPEEKAWIQERIENIQNRTEFTIDGKRAMLERLTAAEVFEKFLDKKYTGTKRFGLDGGESLIPALEQIVKRGGQLGIRELVIGMPHRGRLNVLANFMAKPFQAIFSEFQGGAANPEDVGGSGDVKYHLGTSTDREFDGNKVHLSLTANPSHLEAVNPVVIGKVRAKQDQYLDNDRSQVMGLLMHGDAAFAGQGLVAETLDLSELTGYQTGGTIHVIVNNQIGFTTNPVNARSGPYCSEAAKIVQAPIFHVNGDDPEAVVHVARIATEFRQKFNKDVVVDMFCYRRFGHNEGDEPAFTQPLMYKSIKTHPTTREIYAKRLAAEGVIAEAEANKLVEEMYDRLNRDFEAAKSYKPNKADWLEGRWSGIKKVHGFDARRGETAVAKDKLRDLGLKITTMPDDLVVNSKLKRVIGSRKKMIENGEGIDWATAEHLAFATLLAEGNPLRLSGQDCNRGTFSQRHAAIVDQETERHYKPLEFVSDTQAAVEIIDSPLSEMGVLGFEYGYSLAEPRALVLWEAQFGDFANGAQVIVDQFIASGESKWLRMSGLVMLLPHGYEGQGPEHSSARIERYLQICAEDNIQVVNCTTPAQYFHVLRRQLHRDFRKPLVVATPKSLLRHKRCVSSLADMSGESGFHRVLYCNDLPSPPEDAKQVVLCTGKVYYNLLEAREEQDIKDIHFLRLEQIYPFPEGALVEELLKYGHCDIVWCQEEPRNMGAWPFVSSFLEEVAEEAGVKNPRPRYAGRASAASPATGSHKRHVKEQRALVNSALTLGLKPKGRIASRKEVAE